MKNIHYKTISILFTLFFLNITSVDAQLDTRTQNKVKAKFLTAEELFANKNYSESLSKVFEIEELINGQLLAAAQNLKVKCLIGQGKYIKAKDELYTLEGLNLSSDILKDISVYSSKIEDAIEEDSKRKEREILAEKEKERIKIERKQAETADKEHWENARSENTINSFKNYLSNEKNNLFRKEAGKNIEKLFLSTSEGIEKFIKENGHKDEGHALYKYNYSATVAPYGIKIKSQWRTMKNKIEYFNEILYLEGEIKLSREGENGNYYIWGPYGNRQLTLDPTSNAVEFFEGLQAYVKTTENKNNPKFIVKL